MGMSWRLASRLSVITCAVLVVIMVTLLQRHASPAPMPATSTTNQASGLQGTDLGATAAPNFRLTDQFGKQISLSDLKGKPVILTFLYTHCPDICPLTAEKIHTAIQRLGQSASSVGILAVSTDPKGDTVASALSFSQAHNMQQAWHYLVGSRDQLSAVWSDYHIYASPDQQTISHSTGIFLLDKQGHERIFLGDDFKPNQVTADLQKLLQE